MNALGSQSVHEDMKARTVALGEKLRRALCENVSLSETAHLMASFNGIVATFASDVCEWLDKREETWRLEMREKEDFQRTIEDQMQTISELRRQEDDPKNLATLLQAANEVLEAASQPVSRTGSPSPDGTQDVEPEDILNHWQHDYDGLELIEWNNNFSKKLLHYKSLLSRPEYSRLGYSHRLAGLSMINTKLDDVTGEGHVTQGLGETSNMAKTTATASCQTDDLQQQQQEAATVDGARTKYHCLKRGVKYMCGGILLLLVYFTLCCGIDIQGDLYFPAGYSYLRYGPHLRYSYQVGRVSLHLISSTNGTGHTDKVRTVDQFPPGHL